MNKNTNTEGSFQVKKTKCPTLKPHEEEEIVQFISEKAKKGEPVLRQDIIDLVVKFIKSDNRRNPFRDGIPGDKWFSLFRRRHNDCFIQFQPKVLKALESVGFSEKVLNTIYYKTPPATANGVRNAYLPRKGRKRNTSQSPTPAMPSPTVSEESCQVSISDDMETSRGQESQRDTLDFRLGSKLEVMDFKEKWHPVKVVEVDYDEGEVMVHFETLSDRNYEWLPMDSNRIRQPMLPAVPTKEVFTVDEKVIAVWSYKRKYTATVREVLPDDNYEVLFYDGYAKTLPGCKLFKATEEDQQNIMEYSCDEDPLKEEKVNFVIKQENFCEKDPLKEEEQVKDEIKQEIPEGHLFPVIRLERNREIEEAVLEMLKLEEEEYSCNEDDPLEEETVKYEITQENSSDDDPLGFSEFEEEQVKYETTQDISCDEDPLEEKQVKFEIKQENPCDEDPLGCTDEEDKQVKDEVTQESSEEVLDPQIEEAPESVPLAVKNQANVQTEDNIVRCRQNIHRAARKKKIISHLQISSLAYSCKKCSYSTKRKDILLQHVGSHARERNYNCNQCPYSATHKGSLAQHMKTHTEERPYSCKHCPYSAKHKCDLVHHIMTHTGERPYSCKHCPYSATRKSILVQHMMVHTGERPYTCEHCPYSAAHKGSLVKHMRVHTGERPYTCEHCPYSATQKGRLVRHKRTHDT